MKSVTKYLDDNGYIYGGGQFASPEALNNLQTMMNSMINPKNLYMYVD
jgi:hypothetical protein